MTRHPAVSVSNPKMEVLETYQELIEADSSEISICWKLLPILFNLIGGISSYGAAVLFYILWHEIFAGNCPLWAEIVSSKRSRLMRNNVPMMESIVTSTVSDWRQQIFVAFRHETSCEFYHFASLCSCLFAIAWSIFFAMCGKGGYDSRIFVAPWRVVPPALVFQFTFAVLTTIAASDLEYGYSQFATHLHAASSRFNVTQLATRKTQCDVVQHYFEIYGTNRHSVCKIYPILRILSWIMAASWILGLIVLTLRILSINDFKLLTVTIHKIPEDQVAEYSGKRNNSNESLENI